MTVKTRFGVTNVTNNVERAVVEMLAIEQQDIVLALVLIHTSIKCVIANAAKIVTLLRGDLVTELTVTV